MSNLPCEGVGLVAEWQWSPVSSYSKSYIIHKANFLPIVNTIFNCLVLDLIPLNVTGCFNCGSVSSPGVNVIVIKFCGKQGGDMLPYESIVLWSSYC